MVARPAGDRCFSLRGVRPQIAEPRHPAALRGARRDLAVGSAGVPPILRQLRGAGVLLLLIDAVVIGEHHARPDRCGVRMVAVQRRSGRASGSLECRASLRCPGSASYADRRCRPGTPRARSVTGVRVRSASSGDDLAFLGSGSSSPSRCLCGSRQDGDRVDEARRRSAACTGGARAWPLLRSPRSW